MNMIMKHFAGAVAVLVCALNLTAQEIADSPDDQLVAIGESATFDAAARLPGISYQWLRQWPETNEVLVGETRPELTITNTQLRDVGHYRCLLTLGERVQLTRSASLMVSASVGGMAGIGSKGFAALSSGGPVVVYASPVTGSGSSGTCPGSYAGYVNYTKTTAAGWGWAPTSGTTVHTATDTIQSDTKVKYTGKSYDTDCAQTTVAVPDPCVSTKYRFTIFFPTTVPATNAYPITLTGFDP
jgi:hypothetical protein